MDSAFFQGNRQRLIEALNGGLVVLPGYSGMQWQGDAAAPFRQEANFWYVTGIEWADWWLVIDGRQARSWLVAPNIDDSHQVFDGSLSYAEARSVSGVDEVIDQKAGEQLLKELAKKHSVAYTLGEPPYAKHVTFMMNPSPKKLHRRLNREFKEVRDCQKDLAKLRAIKQPAEIAAIDKAADITVRALEGVRSKFADLTYEYEVEAEITYQFRRHNADHAFEPIVAGGKNACTLHYAQNSDRILPSSLLLIDVGARYGGYSADITRTFAAGAPTKRQAAVHAAVRLAQREIVSLLKPGLRVQEYIGQSESIMKEAILSLGLMSGLDDEASYSRYLPHAVSHGLGVDVHEGLGGHKEFKAGMIITVEPGVYIPEDGVGVRIEDDILITRQGHRNITDKLSTDM